MFRTGKTNPERMKVGRIVVRTADEEGHQLRPGDRGDQDPLAQPANEKKHDAQEKQKIAPFDGDAEQRPAEAQDEVGGGERDEERRESACR